MKNSLTAPYRIVIIGRPNVGKSTLFNRLISKKRAVVHNIPGVTRDRIEEETQWWVQGRLMPAIITDTGGLGGDQFCQEIKQQVHYALTQAQLVLFVFDSQVGLTPADEELYREIQKSGLAQNIPIIAVVNKVDDEKHEIRANEFYQLGLPEVLTVSSEHGRGFDELKETIAQRVGFDPSCEATPPVIEKIGTGESAETAPETPPETSSDRIPRIAIVGRPNVGKSTLLNALMGENRVITSPIAGTTVDSVDVTITLNNTPLILVDTAGIRRKGKTEQGIEVLSVVQAKKTLEKADVALLVLDGEQGTSDQDEKIGGIIEEAGCSVILVLNKWDTQRNNPKFTQHDAAKRIRQKMAYLKYAPILFVSALRNQGFDQLGSLIAEILQQRSVKIPTHTFTEWVRTESTVHNPMNAKFYLCHQTGRHPPTFLCHVNNPEKIDFSLKRHLVNALRERWGYMGSPIRLLFVEGKSERTLPKKLSKNSFKILSKKLTKKSPRKQQVRRQSVKVSSEIRKSHS